VALCDGSSTSLPRSAVMNNIIPVSGPAEQYMTADCGSNHWLLATVAITFDACHSQRHINHCHSLAQLSHADAYAMIPCTTAYLYIPTILLVSSFHPKSHQFYDICKHGPKEEEEGTDKRSIEEICKNRWHLMSSVLTSGCAGPKAVDKHNHFSQALY